MPRQTSSARDRILDAAELLFARQGFDATSIKDIGGRAHVNSALLYYYFKDKETLYRATLRRLVESLVAEGKQGLDAGATPKAAIRSLIEVQVRFLSTKPHIARLIGRELVDHEAAHAEEYIAFLAANLFRRLCDIIAKGQKDGVFRSDLDPRFAAISTVAQVVYFFIARPAVGIMLGHGTKGPPDSVVRNFARHAADFALSALAVGPTASPRKTRPKATVGATRQTRSARRASSGAAR
ncbi:MAG: TetR/AcrR family transcriptional regulator [Gemmatimonadaceae bacterium]